MASRSGWLETTSEPTNPSPDASMWAWLAAELSPGVVDHRQRLQGIGELTVADDQLIDHGRELGDVGPVAGVGV